MDAPAANGVVIETPALPGAERADLPLEIQVLELFSRHNLVVLGPSDVERLTGVSKGTASPRLKSLAAAGYLEAAGGGRYRPGARMFTLATGYLGMVMHHLDQAEQLLRANVGQVRQAMQTLVAAFPAPGQGGES